MRDAGELDISSAAERQVCYRVPVRSGARCRSSTCLPEDGALPSRDKGARDGWTGMRRLSLCEAECRADWDHAGRRRATARRQACR
jgi:hypothetical protein